MIKKSILKNTNKYKVKHILQNNKIYYCMNKQTKINENTKINNLVDIRDVVIDKQQSCEDRILSFVKQIKNPYLFKVGDIVVKINFDNTKSTFQEKFENYLKDSLAY